MKKSIIIALVFAFVLIFSAAVPQNVKAYPFETSGGKTTDNLNQQTYGTYGSTVNSHLIENKDGTLSRIEYDGTMLFLEIYGADFSFISNKEIEMELPYFGGFYSGSNFNFIVFGQDNPKENNSLEVFRVVKYDKSWNRIASVGLANCNTTKPFDGGSLRMEEYGNMLYIHTSHEMYRSSDGYNHQSNMTWSIQTSDMRVTDSLADVMSIDIGYVSHSFNQFIKTAGTTLATVNHGDAYPRSICLITYNEPVGNEQFINSCEYVDLLPISGNFGLNTTKASVGGFEVSNTNYLVAGNSIVQDSQFSSRQVRNIFLSSTPIGNLTQSASKLHWITNFKESGKFSTTTPHLVKINDSAFMLLWQEKKRASSDDLFDLVKDTVKYALFDSTGNMVGKVNTTYGNLSDCLPIVFGNKVVWYTTEDSSPTFHSVPVDGTAEMCKVTFAFENGEIISAYEVQVGGNIPAPTAPKKEGYTFSGWYQGDSKFNFKTPVNTPITLTAKWDKILPKKGTKVTVGDFVYQIVQSSASERTVSLLAPKSKTATRVTIPKTVSIEGLIYKVAYISEQAWKGNTKLTQLIVGDNVSVIGKEAFSGCTALTKVTLGTGIKTIKNSAFQGCKNLKFIQINSVKLTGIGSNVFKSIHANAEIKVPSAKLTSYNKLLKGKGQADTVKIQKK